MSRGRHVPLYIHPVEKRRDRKQKKKCVSWLEFGKKKNSHASLISLLRCCVWIDVVFTDKKKKGFHHLAVEIYSNFFSFTCEISFLLKFLHRVDSKQPEQASAATSNVKNSDKPYVCVNLSEFQETLANHFTRELRPPLLLCL